MYQYSRFRDICQMCFSIIIKSTISKYHHHIVYSGDVYSSHKEFTGHSNLFLVLIEKFGDVES